MHSRVFVLTCDRKLIKVNLSIVNLSMVYCFRTDMMDRQQLFGQRQIRHRILLFLEQIYRSVFASSWVTHQMQLTMSLIIEKIVRVSLISCGDCGSSRVTSERNSE